MLKRRNIIGILIFLIMPIFFCSMETYAKKYVDVKNHFETGIVDIGISEYQNINGIEEPWEDHQVVLPGDRISKIPRIKNYGTDCYVRVKITFRETKELTEDSLLGMNDQWMKADDGWYYYKEILKAETFDDMNEIVLELSEYIEQYFLMI